MTARPPMGAAAGDEPAVEAGEVPRAPTLSAWLPVPTTATGATVVDMTVAVAGQDREKHPFYRYLRRNVVRVEPLDDWRRRLRRHREIFFTPARVHEIRYEDGAIVGLLLGHGPYRRGVRVVEPRLQMQLRNLPVECLEGENLHFGVRGDELISVVRLFDEAPGPVTVEAGSEALC